MIKNNNTSLVEKIYNTLMASSKVSLFAHANQDNDAYGACLGMCLFLRKNHIDARIVDTDLITSKAVLPFINHEIPLADDAFISESTALLLDLGAANMVSSNRWKKCSNCLRIDHHIYSEKMCEYEWVDTEYSSTCEMIGWFITHNNEQGLDKNIVNALYVGILADSGMFMYSCAQSSTFELITNFYTYGFDKQELQTNLLLHPWNQVLDDRNLSNEIQVTHNQIAYLIITDAIKKKYHVQDDENKIFLMNNIADFKVWFSLYYREKFNDYKVSIRSHKYDVQKIASKFGGGGHKLASGFTISSLEQVKDIIEIISNIIKAN